MPVTPSTWIAILMGTLFIIPLYFLTKYYLKTKLFDYMLLGGLFIGVVISNYVIAVADIFGIMDLPKGSMGLILVSVLVDFCFVLSFVLLVVHSIRIKWEKPHRIVVITVILWSVLWITNISVGDILHNSGMITDVMFSLFRMFTQLNTILACLVFITAYTTIEQVIDDRRVGIARILFTLSAVPLIIRAILQLGNDIGFLVFLTAWPIPDVWIQLFRSIFSLMGVFLIAFTSVRFPEALVFSKAQLIRALHFYEVIQSLDVGSPTNELGMGSLVEYLRGIPSELLET